MQGAAKPKARQAPCEPSRQAALAALRAKLTPAPKAQVLSLGDPALAARLPGAGIAYGALHEAQGAAHFHGPAALGFLLGLAARAGLERPGPLVWLRAPGADHGAPYGPGLAGFGLSMERLLIVRPRTHAEALWAAEEAVKTAGPAAVVAELSGPVDLCAGRRLQLAAEKAGALGLIWRPSGALPVAAARTRWRIAAAPSAVPAWAEGAGLSESAIPPGPAQFSAELVHAKGAPPAAFDLEWGHGARGFHLAALVADRAVLQGQSRRAA